MMGLTRQQAQALAFIKGFIAEHDFSPSVVEIQKALGLSSKSSVNRLLVALRDRGFLTWTPFKARSVCLLDPLERKSSAELRNLITEAQRILDRRDGRDAVPAARAPVGWGAG